MFRYFRSTFALASLALLSLVASSTQAATSPADALRAAAEKEGSVVWYATMNDKDLQETVQAFMARYPKVQVQTLRMGSSQLPARVITEQRGGKFNADVISGDGFQVSQLAEAGALSPAKVAEAQKFLPGTVDPNGLWFSLYINTTVLAWNTDRLKADHLKPPSSVADLARPEWKGKIGLDGGALNWYLGTQQVTKSADDLMRKIAANQPQITAGHTVTVTQLESGEFDVTPTAYGYLADQEKQAGKPIAYLNPKPLLVSLNPAALAKNAPHPNAARLLLTWLSSKEGQQYLAQRGGGEISARTDVTNNARIWEPEAPHVVVPAPSSTQYNEASQAFKAIFGIGA